MKTKSLSIFLVALFVVEMNLGAEEDDNKNEKGEKFEYKKMVGDDNLSNFSLKTILIGDSNVGKSALITKICRNSFSDVYSATIGFDFFTLYFNIGSDENKLGPVLKHQIWDCCGNEAYRSLITSFYGNARAFLLAYDVTNDKSFEDIERWVNDVKKKNTDKTISLVLIGTKIDLNDSRKVTEEAGKKFAEENGMKFVEVSAKTGDGIKELEDILAKIIYEEFKKSNIYKEFKKDKEKKEEEKKKKKNENDKKSNEIIEEDDIEVYYKMGEEPTHSSSLCDCCKKICENC